MKSMNDATPEIKSQVLLDEFAEILAFMQTSFQQERTAHEVEIGLWNRILELGRSVSGAWLDLFGDGDAGGSNRPGRRPRGAPARCLASA